MPRNVSPSLDTKRGFTTTQTDSDTITLAQTPCTLVYKREGASTGDETADEDDTSDGNDASGNDISAGIKEIAASIFALIVSVFAAV